MTVFGEHLANMPALVMIHSNGVHVGDLALHRVDKHIQSSHFAAGQIEIGTIQPDVSIAFFGCDLCGG